jgi:transposase-like protein
VGSVTPVIDDAGAMYIAMVEGRKVGRVVPFEDRKVQERIRKTLENRQFRKLSDEIEATLRKNSMVRKDPEMAQAALDMAMQGYAVWSKKPS